MSQFNLIASQTSSAGGTGEVTVIATATNFDESQYPQLKVTGDMKKGDIIFFIGAMSLQNGIYQNILKPTFTQAWTELASFAASDTNRAYLNISYHVLEEDSSGMILGIDDEEWARLIDYDWSDQVNNSPLVIVLRGVNPDTLQAVTKSNINSTYAYFDPITITDSDYVLPIAVSSHTSNSSSFTISNGYDEILQQYVDNRNYQHCLSAAVLRKPGVSGSYTETTWTLANTSTADACAAAIVKLSPL